ncbi:actin-binding protein IPP-like [Drosophila subpulchrella]|uniref:actin-binding protein IPP-like n=1 Tax=Drosophila subpulchrella TaxID=1486046 RepID=UPI0018A17012|nr:actin-binding protein IPP-like [Drosophila subpulchrella]
MSLVEKASSSLEVPPNSLEVDDELELCSIDHETQKLISKSCAKQENESWEILPECDLEQMGFLESIPDIEFQFSCSKEFMIRGINHMLENKKCTDVVVHVGNQSFKCHLPVLQLCTGYFKNLRSVDVVTLGTDAITPKGFELAYEWMTHPNAKPSRKYILDIYLAANFLDMPELSAHLWCRLDDPKLLNGFEAFRLYLQCLPLQAGVLQELMLGRIHKYFLVAVATEEYLALEPRHVFEMLSHLNMCVNSEMEMFMSGVRWLFYDWRNRKEFAVAIMQAIRFNLMPAWYTTVMKSKHSDEVFQELLDMPQIQSMINLGLSFSITHNFLHPTSPLKEPLQMQQPHERQWVFNPNIRHHHRYECPKWRYLNLHVFNEYMEHIIVAGFRYVPSLEYLNPDQMMSCCQEALEKKSLNK